MKFKIMSRTQAGCFFHLSPYAFISISDATAYREPFLETQYNKDGRLALLSLYFWDMDPISDGIYANQTTYYVNGEAVNKPGEGLFTDEDANRILDFFIEWKDKVEFFAVHCNAGISRSSGTAAALQVIADGSRSDQWIFQDGRYQPNRFVYRKILTLANERGLI